jgi:hypothetical protein
VDIVWIFGYGFPPHHGGPMWYAENEAHYSPKGGTQAAAETKELTHA